MQEYIINLARVVRHRLNQSWIIHMFKESLIVLKSGAECRWTFPPSQVRARVHTGAIYVRVASRVIVEWDQGFSKLAVMSKCNYPQSIRSTSGLGESTSHT